MLFSVLQKTFLLAAIQLACINPVRGDNHPGKCENLPAAPARAVGHEEGGPFCETELYKNALIEGMEMWYDDEKAVGLQLRYTSGRESHIWGRNHGKHISSKKCKWDPERDKITRLWHWGTKHGPVCGLGIEFNDKAKECRMVCPKPKKGEFDHDVGEGIMLAIEGRAGDLIDQLRPLMLGAAIEERVVKEFRFGDSKITSQEKAEEQNKLPKKEDVLAEGYFIGAVAGESTVVFRSERTETNTLSITDGTTGHWKIEASMKVEIGPPTWAKFLATDSSIETGLMTGGGVEWKDEETKMEARAYANSWEERVPVPAGTALHCNSSIRVGGFESDVYTVTEAKLVDGKSFTYESKGDYKVKFYTGFFSMCSNITIEEALTKRYKALEPGMTTYSDKEGVVDGPSGRLGFDGVSKFQQGMANKGVADFMPHKEGLSLSGHFATPANITTTNSTQAINITTTNSTQAKNTTRNTINGPRGRRYVLEI